MQQHRKWIILAIVLILVFGGAALAYRALAPGQMPAATGESVPAAGTDSDLTGGGNTGTDAGSAADEVIPAPDFTVYDASGAQVSLSDFAGQPAVVNFWASWCPPCKQELPDFQTLYEETGGEVRFLMVNLTDGQRETLETAQAFITECGYTFPVYFDTDMDAAYVYGISSIPMTLFIDADGNVSAYYVGMIDENTLRTELAAIM